VTAFPYHSLRMLVGDAPTHCPAGHEYPGRIAGRLVEDWVGCQGCGGHHILICMEPGCAYPRLADPPIDEDCDTQLQTPRHPNG
jgi:hypothetical protein